MVATSFTSNVAFVSPELGGLGLPRRRCPPRRSPSPVKRLFGKALAIRLMAWPWPQPMSHTSMPRSSRSMSPSTSGSVPSNSAASWTCALISAISSWNVG